MTPGLLCVHAHPDDEAIATGGVLARAADEGLRAAVVTCTGGELGEIVGEGMDPDELRPRLGEVRRAELGRALEVLGAGEPRFLGYRDSGMLGEPSNDDPLCFWQAGFDEAVGRLVAQIRGFRPDVLVAYDAFGGYGHPDHVQSHRVALVAAEACAVGSLYPEAGEPWEVAKLYLSTIPRSFIAWANAELPKLGHVSPFGEETDPGKLRFGTPDAAVTTVVDVRPQLERKWDALRAHTSQLGPDSFFLNMPPELVESAFGQEWFVRQRSRVPVPEAEDDLFAGLR